MKEEATFLYKNFLNVKNKLFNLKKLSIFIESDIIDKSNILNNLKCQNNIIKNTLKIIDNSTDYPLYFFNTTVEKLETRKKFQYSDLQKNKFQLCIEELKKESRDFNTFHRINSLIKKDYLTLAEHLSIWLTYILEYPIELTSCLYPQNLSNKMELYFYDLQLDCYRNVGCSSLIQRILRILIVGLLLKNNDLMVIQNPELILSPKQQKKIMEFLIFLISNQKKLILITQGEHHLSTLRYFVYSTIVDPDWVVIYYQKNPLSSFDSISINKNGRYINESGSQIGFPVGFFDVSVEELLEIG